MFFIASASNTINKLGIKHKDPNIQNDIEIIFSLNRDSPETTLYKKDENAINNIEIITIIRLNMGVLSNSVVLNYTIYFYLQRSP
jgi:hypothetical protein